MDTQICAVIGLCLCRLSFYLPKSVFRICLLFVFIFLIKILQHWNAFSSFNSFVKSQHSVLNFSYLTFLMFYLQVYGKFYHFFTLLKLIKIAPYNLFHVRLGRNFGTLFWDDITKFWDENLLLFTFLTRKLRKSLLWTNKKFVYLNIITNFCNIIPK